MHFPGTSFGSCKARLSGQHTLILVSFRFREKTFQDTNVQIQHLEEQTKNLNLNENFNKEQSSDKSAVNDSIRDGNGYSQPTELPSPNTIHFIPYYINVLEESQLVSNAKELTRSEKKLLDEYTAREGSKDIEEMMDVAKAGNWGGEKYEMSKAKHGDNIFHKFKKALSLCPNQCLRYRRQIVSLRGMYPEFNIILET